MSGDSGPITALKRTARSRITNGNELLPGIDGRTVVARRYRDIVESLVADQPSPLSEARTQLCRRFAALAVLAENLEARLALGEAISLAEHAQISSTLVRLASRIGLNRAQRDVTPDLRQYIAKRGEAGS